MEPISQEQLLVKACSLLKLPLHAYLDALLFYKFCSTQTKNDSLLPACIYLSTKLNELQSVRIRDIINAVLVCKLQETKNLAFIANQMTLD
jgi:hypothetical protein